MGEEQEGGKKGESVGVGWVGGVRTYVKIRVWGKRLGKGGYMKGRC